MKTLIAAGLGIVIASGAFAQAAPSTPMEAEIAPGLGIPSLGIESGTLPALALLGAADDPLSYPDMLAVGSVGSPGLVAFDLDGRADADIATGSLGPVKP